MNEPLLSHPDLQEALDNHQRVVAGGNDADIAKAKEAVLCLALVKIKEAPNFWMKRDVKDVAKMALGVFDHE